MGGLFIDVFILWIIKTIRNEIRMRKALTWPIADGKVIRSRIEQDGPSYRTEYRPVVDYSFDAKGELFYGQAWGYCQNNGRAAELADMIVPGTSLRIRYEELSPDNNIALNRDNPDFRVAIEDIPDLRC